MIPMKRHILLYPMLLVCGILYAQQTLLLSEKRIVDGIQETIPIRDIEETEDGIKVTYELNGVSLQKDPLFKGAYFVRIDGFGTNATVSRPGTPFRWDSFVIPNGVDVKVLVTDSVYVDFPIEIAPARPLLYDIEKTSISLSNTQKIAPYSGFFPHNIISNIRPQFYRGNSVLDICFNPVKYDYNSKTIRLYKKVCYNILFSNKKNIHPKNKETFINDEYDTFINNTTLNGANYHKEKTNIHRSIDSHTGHPYNPKYIIVSIPAYETAVNRFAEWKRMLGFEVTVMLDDSWTVEKLKAQLDPQKYKTRYLLLVGNHSAIPTETIEIETGSDPYVFNSDYYYSMPDGCFDIPNIYCGRLSISSLAEANLVIDKIINYERYPVDDSSFYNTGLNCAYFQDGEDDEGHPIANDIDGIEDRRFILTSERIRDFLISQGKTVNRVYNKTIGSTPSHFYSGENLPASLTSSSFNWNGDQTDIVDHINNGVFYALYRGHGHFFCWNKPSFMSLANSTPWLQNGNKLPVVFSLTCYTGSIVNSQPCLAESLLRTENGGAVAVYAATRKSYTFANDAIAEGIFDTLWPTSGLVPVFPGHSTSPNYPHIQEYRLGDVLVQAMKKMEATWAGSFVIPMYYMCFGDPSMHIYTEKPTPFDDVVIRRTADSVRVSLPYSSQNILSFYDKGTGEVYSYRETTEEFVTGDADSIVVCVSGPNKIPLIDDPTQEYYIQNETVIGPRTIQSDMIKVGHHVTNLKPEGDVSISGSGKVTLKGNEIILDAGTTLELGTEVEINNP
ncbi:MAG: hypothetical protein IJK43_08880 [Prevotella sp.]|nr:hypothetical protein [Prevotella sp.]